MKYIIFFIVNLCLALSCAIAQQSLGTLTVYGSWENYQALDVEEVGDHLPAIEVYEKHIMPDAINYRKIYNLEIRRDSFYLSVPLTKEYQYVRFASIGKNREERLPFITPFLVQSGDSVHIGIHQNSPLTFESSNPLTDLQFRLAALGNSPLIRALPHLVDENLHAGLDEFVVRMRAAEELSAQYTDESNHHMVLVCLENFRYELLAALCRRLYADTYFGEDSLLHDDLLDKLIQAFQPFHQLPNEQLVEETVSYLSFQYYLHLTLGTIRAILDGATREDYLQISWAIYRSILQIPDGYVRDRTVDLFFKYSNDYRRSGQSGIPLLTEALSATRDLAVKRGLEQRLANQNGGHAIPDFSFSGQHGELVSLHDFQGKVIVAHFWFLGCQPCIRLTKAFEPLMKRYGNQEEIVFLNINVDRDYKKWKSGIQSGNYHHPQEILLHTGATGMSHPMLKYFEFFSVPELVVLDKEGRVVSKRPEGEGSDAEIAFVDRILADLIR